MTGKDSTMTQPHFAKEWHHRLNVLSVPASGADQCGPWALRALSVSCLGSLARFPGNSLEPIINVFKVGISHEILVSVTPNHVNHHIGASFTDLFNFPLALSPLKILGWPFILGWQPWVMVEEPYTF